MSPHWNIALYRPATTDLEGRFNMDSMAPGDYKVFAWRETPANAEENAEFMAPYEARGVAVAVTQQSALPIVVPLIP